MEPVLQAKNISKYFPGVKALDDVSIPFYAGKAHVLLGENGAGKSTLIKVLSGVYKQDEGDVYYQGERANFEQPRDAITQGIAVIHQELSVVLDLTVAENIFLGREEKKMGGRFLDKKSMRQETQALINRIGVNLKPNQKLRDLRAADRQIVEILRAVSQNARVVIMDEPTSSLSDNETEVLYGIINNLKKDGVVIIYISHKLEEIFTIGDTVSILKDGALVITRPLEGLTEKEMVTLMVGREISDYYVQPDCPTALTPLLKVENLNSTGQFSDISFTLNKGEVLGFSGLIGAGRTELMRAIFAADPITSGRIIYRGKETKFTHPNDAINAGIGLVPEDRRSQGLLLQKNVKENISLASLKKNSRRGLINFQWEKDISHQFTKALNIRTPSIETVTRNLSGGNQQKVVLAKWLAAKVDLLILDEPTRGIDVNAKIEIYSLIKDFIDRGGSVILVSSELPELLGVCHRIAVMHEGTLTGVLPIENCSEETIMAYATGQMKEGKS